MATKKVRGSVGSGVASELTLAVATARAAVKAAKTALAAVDLAKLTADERLHTSGRLREGEDRAIVALLDAMDKHAPTFQALADRDGGTDPRAVETAPVRSALERRALLAPLAEELEELLTAVNDDVLACADKAKALSVPAYAIARANATVDAKLRKSVSPTLDFYAKLARRKKKPTK